MWRVESGVLKAQGLQICHCEEATGRRGNLGKAVAISPEVPCHPTMSCEIATGAKRPRNDTSGGAVVHQRPPAVELSCTRRSLSAATPHILAFTVLSLTCTDRQHSAGSGMPLPYNGVCDQRECLPEIATGAKRPRNDKPSAFAVLLTACLLHQCSAGPGCPLPYSVPMGQCGAGSGMPRPNIFLVITTHSTPL